MSRFRQSIGTESARAPRPAVAHGPFWRTPALGFGAVFAVCLAVLLSVPRLRGPREPDAANSSPISLATAACASNLPTADTLDEMASAHAVESLTVQNGNEEPQHEALADANSRLRLSSRR